MSDSDWITKRLNLEYERVVYNAAREGKLYRLKVFLDHKSKEENTWLVSSRTNGSTPLVMACRYGHLDVVLYLIIKCEADLEQTGSVMFDGQTVDGAPPLWCAAAAGHLNIVKCLLRYKACVNSTTKSKSTPLRAACFDGHFEIAKCLIEHGADMEIANKHGHTCLMIACYKGHYKIAKYLVECGADVNKKSDKGNTALHDCAESGNLELVKLLLENGAVFNTDSNGKTPLLSAAFMGHCEIAEYLIKEYDCTKEEKINALELLGATFIDERRDMVGAIRYWRRAMKLRYEDQDCPIEKPEIHLPIASYINTTEIRTLSQLEELRSDPDEMRMQALLTRERVLGPGLPDNLYFVRKRGATYADHGDFDRCIQLWMYALDVQQNALEPLCTMTQSSLLAFTELFSFMMSDVWPLHRGNPFVSFRDIFRIFERALNAIEAAKKVFVDQSERLHDFQFHRFLSIALHLVSLMRKLKPPMNKSEELQLKKAMYRLVHLNPRGRNGWTPLHIACFKDTSSLSRYRVCAFPSLEVVDLLLEVGASPNAVDTNLNTPLHTVAENKPFAKAIFKSLLNHGAHLDQCNNKREVPLQLAQNALSLDIHPLQYVNLQCLCAKAIQSHKVPYKGLVHAELEVFIDGH